MPRLNLKGEETITTNFGAMLSLIVSVLVLLYGITKSSHLQNVKGATISTYEEKADSSQTNALDINERNLRVAFAVEGFLDEEMKADPRYVKWIFRQSYRKDNMWQERILPHHECTEDDFKDFYPISKH